jgi:hypothetical protein
VVGVCRAFVAVVVLVGSLGLGGCGAADASEVTPPGGATRAAAPGAPGPAVPAVTPGPPVASPGGVAPAVPARGTVTGDPAPALRPPPLTPDDLAWLDAIDALLPRMAAVLSGAPGAMTAGTLRGLAAGLGTCAQELTRIGAPSQRLRSVHVLVRRACRGYETGAACFADAAATRSASGVQHDLDCGFAAARTGGDPLAAAASLGRRLKSAG